MAVQDYRQTISWTETVKFGRSIAKVIEDLPNNEEYGFTSQLQLAIVSLPTVVGKDLQHETVERFDELVHLYAIFDLVETLYPAIDISKSMDDLDKLSDLLASGNFAAPLPVPSTPQSAVDVSVDGASTDDDLSTHEEVPPVEPPLDPNVTLEGPPLPDGSIEPQPLTQEPPGSV
jgi:hypothetical protein